MKMSAVFLFVIGSFLGCDISLLYYNPKLEKGNMDVSPNLTANICLRENYRPKTEPEINSMTPRELVDELVEMDINSFDSLSSLHDYQDLIEARIRKEGSNSLTVFTEYLNEYEPKSSDACNKSRFDVVNRLSEDIDRFEFRLKGTLEGQSTIKAFEQAINRMLQSITDEKKDNYKQKSLDTLRGINEVDWAIQRTFRIHKQIEISDNELLNFSNYLAKQKPTYPSWSGRDFVTDNSQTDFAGNPLEVYVLKNPERFYEAYREFKEINH